jgi:transcription elongation factor Elf1
MDNDEDDVDTKESMTPQLPAIGASSFHNRLPPNLHEEFGKSSAAFVSPKFELQYTCKVCNSRNCHLVSRIAYREGVVITTCKGCGSKHTIADNLGKGCLDGESANIEDYFKARGMEDSIQRVNQEVFELEKMLDFDGFVGDDGNPVLE